MRLSDFVGAAVRAPRPSSPSKTPTAAASTAATPRPSSRSPAPPPIAHWVTRLLVCAFECGISIDSLSDYTGSQNITADNDRFLRKWWETASFGAGLWAPVLREEISRVGLVTMSMRLIGLIKLGSFIATTQRPTC